PATASSGADASSKPIAGTWTPGRKPGCTASRKSWQKGCALSDEAGVLGGRECLERLLAAVRGTADVPAVGTVTRLVGLTIEGRGPLCTLGELCRIYPLGGGRTIPAEVVVFHERAVLLMPLGDVAGLGPGSRIEALGRPL